MLRAMYREHVTFVVRVSCLLLRLCGQDARTTIHYTFAKLTGSRCIPMCDLNMNFKNVGDR